MVSVSLEKIIHFKNSLSVELESQKLRIVHRHKEMSKMKIGRGHSLIPRLSLCSVNTHMHTAMYSDYVCAKYDSN